MLISSFSSLFFLLLFLFSLFTHILKKISRSDNPTSLGDLTLSFGKWVRGGFWVAFNDDSGPNRGFEGILSCPQVRQGRVKVSKEGQGSRGPMYQKKRTHPFLSGHIVCDLLFPGNKGIRCCISISERFRIFLSLKRVIP